MSSSAKVNDSMSGEIFLTGATGHIGRLVLDELIRQGYAVRALARRPVALPGCKIVFGALEKPETFVRYLAAAAGVVHLASPRTHSPQIVLEQDVAGMRAMVEAWARGNFVYASSQTVYGTPRGGDLTEETPIDALYWYDLGKITNEFQLKMAAPRSGSGVGVSMRIALQFCENHVERPPQFLGWLIGECLAGKAFYFSGKEGLENFGSSYIGGRDLARAFVAALALKTGGPYNIAGGYCTWRELIETICRHAGRKPLFVVAPGRAPRAGEARVPQSRSFLDTWRFEERSGFRPEESLEELVHDALRARFPQHLRPKVMAT
ncbi:MAG: NAD(P)-dependent oxidoreductase [Betaproteobacteria bacterium]|nr:NAD(P)-dependent oxidoreductase [Betaproteobacteria bacterium]MBI3936898.1 NAD(P)-dependent oxidoreductase [Betaproteobacteria bacterium]